MGIRAYVMIVTARESVTKVRKSLEHLPGIEECNEVMGPYNIVLEVQVDKLSDVPELLSKCIQQVEGVEFTMSLVTIPEEMEGVQVSA